MSATGVEGLLTVSSFGGTVSIHGRTMERAARLAGALDAPSERSGGPGGGDAGTLHAVVVDLVPGLGSPAVGPDAVQGLLHECVAAIQAHLLASEQASRLLRVLIVLDAEAAMGDAGRASEGGFWEAALAGAALSMSRTLSIELVKAGHCVNALLCSPAEAAEGGLPGPVADQMRLLLSQRTAAITGQQIFALDGQDVGRLRP